MQYSCFVFDYYYAAFLNHSSRFSQNFHSVTFQFTLPTILFNNISLNIDDADFQQVMNIFHTFAPNNLLLTF